jgi:hypothetical protein
MGEADGATALLTAWLEGWGKLAAAQTAAAEALAGPGGEAEAEAAWAAVEAQFALWRSRARAAAAAADSALGAETLARYLDPGQWLFGGVEAPDPTLRRLIDGPAPGDLADFGRAALRDSQEWRALRRAAAAHRALVAAAWARCFERAARDAGRDPPLRLDALHARWLAAARAEIDALHGDAVFLRSQRDLVTAAVALREAEARLVEVFCESRALPTRREIDDLHRAVTELRRELRALKRELGRP